MILNKKPDVIHAHLHEGVLIGRLIQVLFFWKKLPLVSDFHGSLVGEMRSHGYLGTPPLGTVFRAVETWINGMGQKAIVSAQENVSIIKSARKDASALYLYDGVNLNSYKKDISVEQLKKKYNVPNDKFIVVYTGALISNKGINHIIEAIPIITKRYNDIYFVIGGFPAERIRQSVREKKIENFVTLISPLNYFELAEVNHLADVAVDPKNAKVRQASGKILQYMAAGTGIICADRPTNHKYLSLESAQFLKDVNAYTISEAIENFYNNRNFMKKCAQNALKDVQKFDWTNIGKKLDDVYKQLVEKN